MKHIDKSLNQLQGEAIISEFLSCFQQRTGTFPADMYKAFCNEIDDNHGHVGFKKRLLDEVLLPEQDDLCCYCLRKLNGKGTIEHIMPNHAADQAELDLYRSRNTPLDRIPHSDDFKSMTPITYPPHPHSIAYQNLVASCDGKLFKENTRSVCCNLKRGDRFIPPFVLYSDISVNFEYTVDGFANWTADPAPPDSPNNAMRILGLNNFILRMIRRIWFYCQDHHIDPVQEGKNNVVNLLFGELAAIGASSNEIDMLLNFKTDKYWDLFLQYNAFANIPHI